MRLNQTSPVESFLLRSGKERHGWDWNAWAEDARHTLFWMVFCGLVVTAFVLMAGVLVARAGSEQTYKDLCAEAADEALKRAGV